MSMMLALDFLSQLALARGLFEIFTTLKLIRTGGGQGEKRKVSYHGPQPQMPDESNTARGELVR